MVGPFAVGGFAFLFGWAPGGSDFGVYDGFDLRACPVMRWLGHGDLAVVGPAGVYLLDYFAPVFSFMNCRVLSFALSPFYILIYMF